MEFKECEGTEDTLKKMLSRLKIAKKVGEIIAKDPIRFIYSPLVSLVASVDPQM